VRDNDVGLLIEGESECIVPWDTDIHVLQSGVDDRTDKGKPVPYYSSNLEVVHSSDFMINQSSVAIVTEERITGAEGHSEVPKILAN
jgi:hypothetical protein